MPNLSQWKKRHRAQLKAEEEKKNALSPTELRNKKNDERTEDLIKKYIEIRNKNNPTKSDTTAYNEQAMRASKPLLKPKKESTKKDNKGNPKSPEDVVLNDIVLARMEKAKQNIILNQATPSDSLTMYNAGIFDKNVSEKESERFKPQSLKKAEREAEESRKSKVYEKQVQPVSMEMVDGNGDGTKDKAIYYLEKDGKKTEITKSVYDAINAINRKKLKKYVDPSVNIMEDPDDPLGIG